MNFQEVVQKVKERERRKTMERERNLREIGGVILLAMARTVIQMKQSSKVITIGLEPQEPPQEIEGEEGEG